MSADNHIRTLIDHENVNQCGVADNAQQADSHSRNRLSWRLRDTTNPEEHTPAAIFRDGSAGNNMLDLALVTILAWSILLGIILGLLRMLMALSTCIGVLFTVELGSPWLRLLDTSPGITGMDRWLRRILSPDLPVLHWAQLPAMATGGAHLATAMRVVYLQVNLLGYAAAVAIGFLLALRSLETLWTTEVLRRSNRLGGACLGAILGIGAILGTLRILVFVGWWMHPVWIGALVRNSAVFQFWGHWITLNHHGIFF